VGKIAVSRRPSIDTGEKHALAYGGFSHKTAVGAARAAICGEYHSATSEGNADG